MYLFKQKFDLRELTGISEEPKRILVAIAEEYLRALYIGHLSEENFYVKPCGQMDALHEKAAGFSPHLLVVGAGSGSETSALVRSLVRLKEFYPGLVVVAVGFGSGQEDIKKLMAAGVNAHIDRKFSQPKDIVTIVKTLLTSAETRGI